MRPGSIYGGLGLTKERWPSGRGNDAFLIPCESQLYPLCMRKLFFLGLFLACASGGPNTPMTRGPYPKALIFGESSYYTEDARAAVRNFINPVRGKLEDSLGFKMREPEFKGIAFEGDTTVFWFFFPALAGPMRKLHPIYAGAWIYLVVQADTARAIYFKELPWE